MSNYEVTMSNYYEKSKNIKSDFQNTVDEVQQNYLDKVSANIGTLDSRDKDTLIYKESYTDPLDTVTVLNDSFLPTLTQMSTENDANPMNPIVEKDNEYKSKFQDFTDGKRSEEISAEVKEIGFTFEARKQVDYWLSILPEGFNPDLVKQIESLLPNHPKKAFETLYASKDLWNIIFEADPATQKKYLSILQNLEEYPSYVKIAKEFVKQQDWFWDLLDKNEKYSNVYLAVTSIPEVAKGLPKKVLDRLYDSKMFIKALDKCPDWLQNKVIDAMSDAYDGTLWAKIMEKSDKFTGFFEKVSGYLGKVKSGKLAQSISKLMKSPLAQKLTNNPVVKKLLGPWGGLIIDAGFSGFESYNNPSDPAYHSIGKAAFSGSIDAIKNASVIDGALIGAAYGGPWGAAIGVGVVLTKDLLGWAMPDWDTKLKNGFNSIYDWVADSCVGKGITNSVNSVKTSVGNAFHEGEKAVKNFVSDAAKNLFSGGPSLGWFG